MTMLRYRMRPEWSLLDDMLDLQQGLNRFFDDRRQTSTSAVPPVNVWQADEAVVVDVELPGADPKTVDITLKDQVLTLRGQRSTEEFREGETVHRRERATGEFMRRLSLPYRGDLNKVTAVYSNGILRITVPRAEADKPRKIAIQAD